MDKTIRNLLLLSTALLMADPVYRGASCSRCCDYKRDMTADEKREIYAAYKDRFRTYRVCGVEINARSKNDARRIYDRLQKKKV